MNPAEQVQLLMKEHQAATARRNELLGWLADTEKRIAAVQNTITGIELGRAFERTLMNPPVTDG